MQNRYGLITDFDPIAAMQRDALALADAAELDLTAPVPSCPGWDAAELVRHVREVHLSWGALVRDRQTEPPDDADLSDRPQDGPALVADYRDTVRWFAGVLADVDPATPVWTWAPHRQDAGFVARHQVQEAAVHRWDAEDAAGRSFVIDTLAAADAVQEFLECSLPARVEGAAPIGGDVVLAAPDAGLSWVVGENDDATARFRRLEPGEAPPDPVAVVRGTASDLLLLLYRRRHAADLDVEGDPAAADRLAARSNTD